MTKLHEVLAVEGDLKGAAEKIFAETINTFSKKEHHFTRRLKTYQSKDEEGETFPAEKQDMVTTVPLKLDHTKSVVSRYLDAVAQKEVTNTCASAKIEIDGVPLIDQELPATLLLALEGKLKQIREVYEAIPTLDPAETWTWDSKTNTYEAEPRETFKSKKVMKNHVKAPATDRHPAQVDTYNEDVRVGTWTEKKWSGMVTPAEKSELIARLDKLTQAVKQARQRANDRAVEKLQVGEAIFGFINEPLKKG